MPTHSHLWFMGSLHMRNGFYTVQNVFSIALNLPLTENYCQIFYFIKHHLVAYVF